MKMAENGVVENCKKKKKKNTGKNNWHYKNVILN